MWHEQGARQKGMQIKSDIFILLESCILYDWLIISNWKEQLAH